jgi:putative IMPACT (imprinted ancient) family translation regulator
VLRVLPLAEKVPTVTVMMAVPYNWFERIRLWVTEGHGEILDEDFGADVTVTARFAQEQFTFFQSILSERSAGNLYAEVVETNDGMIMPIGAYGDDRLNL